MRFGAYLALLATVLAYTLSYEDSLKVIAMNQLDPYDDSNGTVWFNTTGYGLEAYGFNMLDDYGIYTYSTFNYLTKLVQLAGKAASEGKHGDVVLLFYKFIYAGNPNATAVKSDSDMITDISLLLQSKENKSGLNEDLIHVLTKTSSSNVISDVYFLASNVTSGFEKGWLEEDYAPKRQADSDACRSLKDTVTTDWSWKSGGPRNIEYRGCFVSWSANATFQIEILNDGANNISALSNGEVLGADLGTFENQCLSNRADGCSY